MRDIEDENWTVKFDLPRDIDADKTFNALVDYVHDEFIVKKNAPGFVIGISGTDSILTYLICARAFEKAGRPERVIGIHFGEERPDAEALKKRLAEDPQALWFQREVMPWLQGQAPNSPVFTDNSMIVVNGVTRRLTDGVRWGMLRDWSVTEDLETGRQRPREEGYWVVGTQNATEKRLMNYSNSSVKVSVNPIEQIWKSEVLKICAHLGVPKMALEKSREADCVCGRFQLPALNIEDVDALLMAREGILNWNYIKNSIPDDLRAELEAFIDKQIADAGHKAVTPYPVSSATVVRSENIDNAKVKAAYHFIADGEGDAKAVSIIAPDIIRLGQANLAANLVGMDSVDRNAWLPEALMLFDTPGLRSNQKRQMLQTLFNSEKIPLTLVNKLSGLNARLGALGFSFPQWRYLSQQGKDAPSLLEQFGMQRLYRRTDVRDPSLPASDPNRDLFGPGFALSSSDWYVEYRRGYIVCSNRSEENPATVIIRNNSYFFGRDRMKAPVYVSWRHLGLEQIRNITPASLETSALFSPWQNAFHADPNLPMMDKAKRLDNLLSHFEAVDNDISNWLRHDGLAPLIDFLDGKVETASGKAALHLAATKDQSPPWFPQQVVPLTTEVVGKLKKLSVGKVRQDNLESLLVPEVGTQSKLVLLTGANGDFPIIEKAPSAPTALVARPVLPSPQP